MTTPNRPAGLIQRYREALPVVLTPQEGRAVLQRPAVDRNAAAADAACPHPHAPNVPGEWGGGHGCSRNTAAGPIPTTKDRDTTIWIPA